MVKTVRETRAKLRTSIRREEDRCRRIESKIARHLERVAAGERNGGADAPELLRWQPQLDAARAHLATLTRRLDELEKE